MDGLEVTSLICHFGDDAIMGWQPVQLIQSVVKVGRTSTERRCDSRYLVSDGIR